MGKNDQQKPIIDDSNDAFLKSNKIVWVIGAILLLIVILSLVLFGFKQSKTTNQDADSSLDDQVSNLSWVNLDQLETCRPADTDVPLLDDDEIRSIPKFSPKETSRATEGTSRYLFSINTDSYSHYLIDLHILLSDQVTTAMTIKEVIEQIKTTDANSRQEITIDGLKAVIGYVPEDDEPIDEQVAHKIVFITGPLPQTRVCLAGEISKHAEEGRIVGISREEYQQALEDVVGLFIEADKTKGEEYQRQVLELQELFSEDVESDESETESE